jgi:2-succinyl-6-hydroxy-2,4-cyclohexadiene-1-carboxylate synthase
MMRLEVGDGVGYAVRDDGAGMPVLLLHGFTGSGATWVDWLPDLVPGYRAIAVDLLGHGDSDSPAPARHAVECQAADLATIMRRLDATPARVVGYSFGARIALQLAIDSAASVSALVLESPSAGITDVTARAARREEDRRWVEQLQRGDMVGFARDWAAQPIFASQTQLSVATQARIAAVRAANRPAGLAASLLGAGQGVMTPLHDRLGEISVPTLVISGGLDPRGTERAAAVATGIPGSLHESIEDAGHAPHLERPERFRDLVTSFLATPLAKSIPTFAP